MNRSLGDVTAFGVVPCLQFGFAVTVHLGGIRPDECLIALDWTAKAELVSALVLQNQAETLKHEPCRFLGHPQITGKFVGTNAVFAIAEQPHGRKPFGKRNWRILEDGPDLHRELATAMAALPTPLSLEVVGSLSNAPIWAFRLALFPAHFSHGINANLLIFEGQDGFAECLRVFHESTVAQNGGLVKYIYAVTKMAPSKILITLKLSAKSS